jgi:hypothetical protein
MNEKRYCMLYCNGEDIVVLLSRCSSTAMETLEQIVSEGDFVSSSVTTNATNASATTITTTSTTRMTISPLDDFNLLQNIISFVGKNQYRFVAAINRDFQAVYLKLFPDNKQTYYNASTVGHAALCYNDLVESNEKRLPRSDFTSMEWFLFEQEVSEQKITFPSR